MTENTNIVKKWAQNMLSDANSALAYLSQVNSTSGYLPKAMTSIAEIKGCCEAIIATMEVTESSTGVK